MRKYTIGIIVTTIVFIFVAVLYQRTVSRSEEIHIHAGFIVYKDGKREDFSDFKYMHVKPCGEEHGPLTPEDEQQERAHLHDGVGDVVHVHRNGATWGDLFENIDYSLGTSPLKGYINGEPVDDILTKEINAYDSMTLVIGDQYGADLSKSVSRNHILEVEKKSELCAEDKQ